jgi:hypothetical protein
MNDDEYYVFFNLETGAATWGGKGSVGATALQVANLPEGAGVIQIPQQAVLPLGGVNLDVIKNSYAASIDADADKVRSRFITNTPGQMATYLEKEAEARRVLADPAASTIFLSLEAAALGIDVVELAHEVVTQADLWRPIGARIEAARRKAKVELEAAPHLAAIAAAIRIDWPAVAAGTL